MLDQKKYSIKLEKCNLFLFIYLSPVGRSHCPFSFYVSMVVCVFMYANRYGSWYSCYLDAFEWTPSQSFLAFTSSSYSHVHSKLLFNSKHYIISCDETFVYVWYASSLFQCVLESTRGHLSAHWKNKWMTWCDGCPKDSKNQIHLIPFYHFLSLLLLL